MTNFENIKQMNVEQMANLLDKIGDKPCVCCIYNLSCDNRQSYIRKFICNCLGGIEDWLNEERVEE